MNVLVCVVNEVRGVTRLNKLVYVVCHKSSTISRFSTTGEPLADINVKGLSRPRDIVACEGTSQLYVADCRIVRAGCVWRVSSDGADMKRWLPKSPSDTVKAYTLSVRATRLLVTSYGNKQLIQFDATGDEVTRVPLPDYMSPLHAVESPTGTFIVSYKNTQQKQCQVSEVNTEGHVLFQFTGSLGLTPHIAVDSQGNIFVADHDNRRILLLDAQLALRHVIIEGHQLNNEVPQRLCYMEQSGQLLVGFARRDVAVFDVLQR